MTIVRAVQTAAALAVCMTACGRYSFDPIGDAGGDGGVVTAANIPTWTSGTRLRAKVADFGGGALDLLGWFDSALGVDCTIDSVGTDGERYCFPQGANIVFSDAGCTSPLAGIPGTDPLPARASSQQIVGGRFLRRYYPVATELFGVSYYSGTPGSCNGPYGQGTSRIFEVGAEIDPATFPHITAARLGTGRLKQDGWQSDDGASYFDQLFDGTRQLPCTFLETTQGMRCVTSADGGGFHFADAACTIPLAEPPGPVTAEGVNYTERCGLTHRHERGTPFTGTAYHLLSGRCSAVSATGFDTLGTELDPSIFVSSNATTGTETGRLVSFGLVAFDGAHVRRGWHDTMRGNERCGRSSGPLFGGSRCLPDLVVSNGDFGDAACAVPIAAVDPANTASGACPVPYILAIDMRGPLLTPVSAPAAAPTQRFHYGFSCLGDTFDGSVSYVVGGPPISIDSFALGTDRVE